MTDPQVAILMLCLFIVLVLLGFPIAFTLLAMGVAPEVAHGSIRLSIARHTTDEEIDGALPVIIDVVSRLRESVEAVM